MNNHLRCLRVALVASSLRLGGAEKQTVYMTRALLRAGIEASFFYLSRGGHYESAVRQTGIPFRQIYSAHRPCRMLARLTGAFCRLRPHIVLATQFGDLLYAAAPGRLCNALTLGGVRSDGWYELTAHGRLSRLMLRLAHGLIANSFRARQVLASQGVQPLKMEVLPNVIDLEDFDARSAEPGRIPLSSERIIAAAVGALHPCKRFDRFLDALALARRSEPRLAGIISGTDVGARTALEEQAAALGLTPPDLTFLGECDCIPALLARSGMLVLASELEGFPNVILEAMAARLPVITTPAGDAGLIVRHGKTGFVVHEGETQNMAEFMVRLARSASMRIELGEAGRKRVEQNSNYESLPGRLVDLFRNFADREGRTSLCEMLERGGARAQPIEEQILANALETSAKPVSKPSALDPVGR